MLQCLDHLLDVLTEALCMQQAEEDGYPMYSPYVETDPLSIEDIQVKEDDDGPAWFFVVRSCSLAAIVCSL